MCGIAGDVDLLGQPDAEGVRRAARAIAHRGPDAESFFVEGPAALGHRRLSIIDLATGDQPMTRDGVTLIFNGEAYDFADLRAELAAKGHPFTTRSDTEVVLRAYLEWGEEFARHVHGMFALALWDSRFRKLVLARDRLGKKPIYYFASEKRCVFASELKALAAHGAAPRELDPQALVSYLACEYVPSPLSIYKSVRKLPAGHVAVLDSRGFRTQRYWELPKPEQTAPPHAEEELLSLLEKAVQKRLVADVPVGVFLSGGIDSTTIAALAARHKRPLRTFSIGFTEESFDESPWSLLASQRLGTEHSMQKFSGKDCLDLLPAAVAQLDEPFADPSFLPTLLLSKFTRQHVTVALAGDGGDELFAGYDPFLAHRPAAAFPRFLKPLVLGLARLLPSSSKNMSLDFRVKQFLRGVDAPRGLRHAYWLASFLPDEISQLLRPELRGEPFAHVREGDSIDDALHYYVTHYLADDILVKADRASMAASLELRAPFLDTAVVEFAMRLPWRTKLSLTRTKVILKKAVRGVVPDEILRRPKKGFGIPVAAWLRGPLRELLEESVKDETVFEPQAVRKLVQAHLSGRADLRKPLWTLLMFQLWHKQHAGAATLRSAA